MKNKKRKWIICVLAALVLLLLVLFSLGHLILFIKFRREGKRFNSYDGQKMSGDLLSYSRRVEMSKEQYTSLRSNLLDEGWSVQKYMGEGEIAGYAWGFLTEEEKKEVSERLYRRIDASKSTLSGQTLYIYENLTVVCL